MRVVYGVQGGYGVQGIEGGVWDARCRGWGIWCRVGYGDTERDVFAFAMFAYSFFLPCDGSRGMSADLGKWLAIGVGTLP